MEQWDILGLLAIILSYNVTIVGKIWLALMTLLRLAVIVFAGFSLYQDEQERFICNTLQPGCSNVCYDAFFPVSHFRFWLVQTMCVLLPYTIFIVHVLHHASLQFAAGPSSSKEISSSTNSPKTYGAENVALQDFSGAYIIHLLLRTITEAAFSAGQYFLFGFLVPQSFSCHQPPCTSAIDCYISRPTEKSIMVIFIWGISGVSIFLSVVDLICVIQTQIKVKTLIKEQLRINSASVQEELYSTTIKKHTEYHQNLEGSRHHLFLSDLEKRKDNPTAPASLLSEQGATSSLHSEIFTHDTTTSNINTNSNKKLDEFLVCPSLTHPVGNVVAECNASEPHSSTHWQSRKGWHDKNPPPRNGRESLLPNIKYLGEGCPLEAISCDLQSNSSNNIRATKSQWV
ncbi:gap junction delta-4 protein [Microcaecilia unicolor]|uniref:Gap junction protein n=1 Tax=Microcaecilia unicolor TaxID=1415580 RepID=A0A6P7XXZ3_9AMPH|nr:gap junction delta-4 protein [Microcaecilia unicolor]